MTLIGALLTLCCILLYTGQHFFNKVYSVNYRGPEAAATPVFAAVYGAFVAIVTFAINGFKFAPTKITVILGCINGVVLFLYNLGSIKAARSGPYAFQTIMTMFGAIACSLAFSALYWKQSLTIIQIIGVIAMLASFVLFNIHGLKFEGMKKGYFIWVFLLFFSNGAYAVIMDTQQKLVQGTQRNEMIMITFAVSAVISLIYLFCLGIKHPLKCFNFGKKAWIFALLCSCCAAAAINVLLIALGHVTSAPILYTVENGGMLMTCTLLGVLVLKEKMTPNTLAGFAVGLVSIILLNL